MANPVSHIDVMRRMLHEILLETGHQLKASRNSGDGDIRYIGSSINIKTRTQYETYQAALSALISEIQDAKLVCARDLERLKATMAAQTAVAVPSPKDTDMVMGDNAAINDSDLISHISTPAIANLQLGTPTEVMPLSLAPFSGVDGGDELARQAPALSVNVKQELPQNADLQQQPLPMTSMSSHTIMPEGKLKPSKEIVGAPALAQGTAERQGQGPRQTSIPPTAPSSFTNIQFAIAAPTQLPGAMSTAGPASLHQDTKMPVSNESIKRDPDADPGMGTGVNSISSMANVGDLTGVDGIDVQVFTSGECEAPQ